MGAKPSLVETGAGGAWGWNTGTTPKSLPARLVLTQARLATSPALRGDQTFMGHVPAEYEDEDLDLVQHVDQENRRPINKGRGGFAVALWGGREEGCVCGE